MVLDELEALVRSPRFEFVISTARTPKADHACMEMAEPATLEQIRGCEGALRTALPASMVAFLSRWNGGRLWQVMRHGERAYETIRLFGTDELVERNLWIRQHLRQGDDRPRLFLGQSGNWYHLLDLTTGAAEPPVIGGWELRSDWHKTKTAESFTDFLGKLLDSDGAEFWIPNNRAGLMEHVLGVLEGLIVQAPWAASLPVVGWVDVTHSVMPGVNGEELATLDADRGMRLPHPLRVLLKKWNGGVLYRISQDDRELWAVRILDAAEHQARGTVLTYGDRRYLVFADNLGDKFALDLELDPSPVYVILDGASPFELSPSLPAFLWTLIDEDGRRFWVGQ